MREMTVRIRFTQPSLGNVESPGGRMLLPRDNDDCLVFMPTWHKANMALVAPIYGKHQREVRKISWDPRLDVVLREHPWYRRVLVKSGSKRVRYVLHEAIFSGQIVGVNCIVPRTISDDDLFALMNLSGRYKGLSPYRPGEYGRFEVEELIQRRRQVSEAESK